MTKKFCRPKRGYSTISYYSRARGRSDPALCPKCEPLSAATVIRGSDFPKSQILHSPNGTRKRILRGCGIEVSRRVQEHAKNRRGPALKRCNPGQKSLVTLSSRSSEGDPSKLHPNALPLKWTNMKIWMAMDQPERGASREFDSCRLRDNST